MLGVEEFLVRSVVDPMSEDGNLYAFDTKAIPLTIKIIIDNINNRSIFNMSQPPFDAPRDFAYCSFAFSVVTGFCIGGSALANIVGIGYINKRLSLSKAVIQCLVYSD